MTRVTESEPKAIWTLGAPLLEGPVWVERDQALWFVCIKSRRIFRFDPATHDRRVWEAPSPIGFCLPAAGGGFVAGLQTGLALFEPANGGFRPLVDPEPHLPGNRLNDATVDASGALWFGTMDDDERRASGRIYRLSEEGACDGVTMPVAITNGPVIAPDGRTLYHVDTLAGTIFAAHINDRNRLTDQRVFAHIPAEKGYPDGPVVDAEGCLWIGLFNGAAVRRYAPDGTLREEVRFPVSAVTKVAFGGPDRRTVFATTAAKHLSPADQAPEPLAGSLFSFRVGVPGQTGHEIAVGL